jgi:hypothetical protein
VKEQAVNIDAILHQRTPIDWEAFERMTGTKVTAQERRATEELREGILTGRLFVLSVPLLGERDETISDA